MGSSDSNSLRMVTSQTTGTVLFHISGTPQGNTKTDI